MLFKLPDHIREALKAEMNGRQVIENGGDLTVAEFQDIAYTIDTDGIFFFPMVVMHGERKTLIGGADVNKGMDLFWDGKNWYWGKHGVFTEKYVFVTDYYGFPKGALYTRM